MIAAREADAERFSVISNGIGDCWRLLFHKFSYSTNIVFYSLFIGLIAIPYMATKIYTVPGKSTYFATAFSSSRYWLVAH
ncbi:hypothetical protein O9929_24315 [Vibrio lentus]|nr:hypothetical protein [Vibrio lentus]